MKMFLFSVGASSCLDENKAFSRLKIDQQTSNKAKVKYSEK